MENLNAVLAAVLEREYKVSGDKLNQVQRNATKAELLDALMGDLPREIVVGKCKEGVVLLIDNENEGGIAVVLDLKIKPLTFDAEGVVENYRFEQKEKEERAAARKRDQAATYKNAMALKAKREAEKKD